MNHKNEAEDYAYSQKTLETSAHHPNGTVILTETPAGPIYRIPVQTSIEEAIVIKDIPPGITMNAITSNRTRDRITRKLSFNSRTGLPEVGRPNSAFLHRLNGDLFIDHLLENQDHEREGTPHLHTIIRENVDYFQSDSLLGRITVLSGHIAPLNHPTSEIDYIMLLDKFAGVDAYDVMEPPFKQVIDCLSASRILSITSDGFIIPPPGIQVLF